MKRALAPIALFLLTQNVLANQKLTLPPQPTSCIAASFSNTGSQWWKSISLKLTNQCGTTVDFQNATITFLNASNLNTTFWGEFSAISYPINQLLITSQAQSSGKYLSTLNLQFTQGRSSLASGKSVTINYGAPAADYDSNSTNVYLGNMPANTAEIDLINTSAKPASVTQSYALVHLTFNGQSFSDVQVPWKSTLKIPNLAEGGYSISPVNVSDASGNVYQGSANPTTVTAVKNKIVSSSIAYSSVQASGNIAMKLQALPTELSGYTNSPVVSLTNQSNNSVVTSALAWNSTKTVANLVSSNTYRFSTPDIIFNGYKCSATFTPATAIAASVAPLVNIGYTCAQIPLDNITINVTGVPSTVSSVTTTFTPNDGGAIVSKNVSLANGQGSAVAQLTDKTIYTVSSSDVNGYTATYSPRTLTASANGSVGIAYAANTVSTGRIIGYLPGWKTPPSATELAAAGYTHMMVSFGVFSTTQPGMITPAFDTVTASYIQSLKSAGIKVLLSLGGASSSIAGTTVNFHQAISLASSPAAFTTTFIQSMENLMTTYGFDGFDIDIESGLGGTGTFTNPQGDIAVMANIINTMHAKHPTLLLTLAPQTANISATSGFSEIWGNYASLVMQTYNSLEWVGIQNYNTGCMFGIDHVCYDPNQTNSPDFSVAMATDLLESWPAGQGFQPYTAFLKPSQIVLGYLVPNAQGVADGGPVIPVPTIKRALQCLRTATKGGNSCDTYVPPKAYPGIGGVFDWEVTYDQSNSYRFATGLKSCVMQGSC